ncbi:MAG: DUF1573 domain-containing protein [Bacteroidales bacterium]|nr:DUF1573 domain-containing protein [Bacteroidales bacterium]
MKKLVLSLSISMLFFLSASAQVSADKSAKAQNDRAVSAQQAQTVDANPNAPQIVFDKLVHDYGDINQHGDGKCEFKFTNEGKEPLILSNVRSSCGCTVPEWPRQPILPGNSEIIKVKYDTKRVGVINKTIHVYSNATDSPVTLRIQGKVLASNQSSMPEKKMDREASPVNK